MLSKTSTIGREYEEVNHLKAILPLIFDWTVLGSALWAATWTPWYAWPLLILIIGARQHGLLILMHEQVHYHFLKNNKLGEIVSDLFIALPIGISTRLYRDTHFKHHQDPNSDIDPDYQYMKDKPNWQYPPNGWAVAKLVLKDLFLLNWRENFVEGPFLNWWSPVPKLFKKSSRSFPLSYKFFVLSYFAGVIALIWLLSVPLVVPGLWFLAMVTAMPASVRLRAFPEHLGVEEGEDATKTRTVAPLSWLEAFFVAPHNINVHREHHLNPRIPHYRLLDFRKSLGDKLGSDKEFSSYFGKKGAFSDLVKTGKMMRESKPKAA